MERKDHFCGAGQKVMGMANQIGITVSISMCIIGILVGGRKLRRDRFWPVIDR